MIGGKIMAVNITRKKPLFGNRRSHALNATKMQQKPNKQTKKIEGIKVTMSAREWKSFKKAA